MITALEWVLVVTGVLSTLLSWWALHDSYRERRVLVRANVNGLKWATVDAHVSRDLARLVASLILLSAGVWLLCEVNDVERPAVVSKIALMLLGWLMSFSVFADRVMRERIHVHLDKL